MSTTQEKVSDCKKVDSLICDSLAIKVNLPNHGPQYITAFGNFFPKST